MRIWLKLVHWLMKRLDTSKFERGYKWGETELWWGVSPEEILVRCDSPFKTDFDKGVEKAARDYLSRYRSTND